MPPKRKAASAAKPVKKAKPEKKTVPKAQPQEEDDSSVGSGRDGDLNLIVEHCKQCQCFKRRTAELEKLIRVQVPEVQWTVNPEKPRKGCFEVRDKTGRTYISLLNMPRPFKRLKDLDLEEVAEKILDSNAEA